MDSFLEVKAFYKMMSSKISQMSVYPTSNILKDP